MTQPTGWYADPQDPAERERYWDGATQQWTSNTRPSTVPYMPPPVGAPISTADIDKQPSAAQSAEEPPPVGSDLASPLAAQSSASDPHALIELPANNSPLAAKRTDIARTIGALAAVLVIFVVVVAWLTHGSKKAIVADSSPSSSAASDTRSNVSSSSARSISPAEASRSAAAASRSAAADRADARRAAAAAREAARRQAAADRAAAARRAAYLARWPYANHDGSIRWKWLDPSGLDCYLYCGGIKILAKRPCASVYAEANLVNSSGSVVDYSNAVANHLPRNGTAILVFQFTTSGGRLQETQLDCTNY